MITVARPALFVFVVFVGALAGCGEPQVPSAVPSSTAAPTPISEKVLLSVFRVSGIRLEEKLAFAEINPGSPISSTYARRVDLRLHRYRMGVDLMVSSAAAVKRQRFYAELNGVRGRPKLAIWKVGNVLAWSGAVRTPGLVRQITVAMARLATVCKCPMTRSA